MKNFLQGYSHALGIAVGFLPIAMSFGAIAIQNGLSEAQSVVMSMWLFAGAAQFAAVEALGQNLSEMSIVVTVLLINLRHIPKSLAIQSLYSRFGRVKNLVLCYGLIDETFAIESADRPRSFSYYLGVHWCCWLAWVAGTWLGVKFGVFLPSRWLFFALPGLFVYLLVELIKKQWRPPMALVLALGIALVIATQPLGSTGILISIVGIAIAASRFLPAI